MEGYIAEVRLFAGNFAPLYWQYCMGQSMSIAENTALYSLIGTLYGGDGQQSFQLPDLRGRVPVGAGTGIGLPTINVAEADGSEVYMLLTNQMPMHNHAVSSGSSGLIPLTGNITATMNVDTNDGTLNAPSGNFLAAYPNGLYASAADTAGSKLATNAITMATNNLSVNLSTVQISPTGGGGQPINKMMPFLVLNYIICVEGIYPSRN